MKICKMFFVFGQSFAKLAAAQPRFSAAHSQHRQCKPPPFNLKSIHFSFLSMLSISIFVAGFDHEFVAVQSPSPSSLALETSYEDESIFSAPMGPLPRCQYSLPLSNIPLNRWIALTCSHRSSPQLNTDRGLADLRERRATYGASRFFCFPISIRLNSSQRRANWQLS